MLQYHAAGFKQAGAEIIAVADPAPGAAQKAATKWGIPNAYESVDAMLAAIERHRPALVVAALNADVVELTSFHVGPTDPTSFQAEFARFAPIHHAFFPTHYPAWSAVGTSALLAPGAVVEMRAVAMIGSGRAPKADIPKPAPRPATP